jgi:hypothetical protein
MNWWNHMLLLEYSSEGGSKGLGIGLIGRRIKDLYKILVGKTAWKAVNELEEPVIWYHQVEGMRMRFLHIYSPY